MSTSMLLLRRWISSAVEYEVGTRAQIWWEVGYNKISQGLSIVFFYLQAIPLFRHC